MTDRAPCGRCAEPISVDAKECPHCEYKGYPVGAVILIIIGMVASATIVGAIIGIPLLIAGVIYYIKTVGTKLPSGPAET